MKSSCRTRTILEGLVWKRAHIAGIVSRDVNQYSVRIKFGKQCMSRIG